MRAEKWWEHHNALMSIETLNSDFVTPVTHKNDTSCKGGDYFN